MPKLIGLTGRAQSGKSTVAKFLKHKYSFHEDSFAAPIRRFIADICAFSLDALEHYKEKKVASFTKTPREMMQTVGTEWGRNMIQDDLWIEALKLRYIVFQRSHAPGLAPAVVISDIRFENEAATIRELGGEIWHILRPGPTIESDHVSESGINIHPLDRTLFNIGTEAELYHEVVRLLETLDD